MPISLVLADDHPVVLAGVEQLLSLEDGLVVLARCANGEEALQAVRRHRPDVLVLDLNMPRLNGLAVLRELRHVEIPTRVVVLTASLGAQDLLEAVRLGARGLILKHMAPNLLVECIRAVHAGGRWLEGDAARALGGALACESASSETQAALTLRELGVMRMVAQGMRNKEIAHKLAITEGTVKIHLHNIYNKVEVDSRVALTLWAQDKGLL